MKKIVTYILPACGLAVTLLATACHKGAPHYDATGLFEAKEVVVSAEASGRLMQFKPAEGMEVLKGEELGCIDTIQLQLQKEGLQAGRLSVQQRTPDVGKQMAILQEELATARRERVRVQRLVSAGAANAKQLDDVEARIHILENQLEAQQAALKKTVAGVSAEGAAIGTQIAQVNDMLRRTHITSPIDGTILVTYAEEGEITAPGRPLFRVADVRQMTLRAYITSVQLSQLSLGDTVQVYADYGDDITKAYKGVVAYIADKAEFTPKMILTKDERANQVYAVKITVPNPDKELKIGMYGGVVLKND